MSDDDGPFLSSVQTTMATLEAVSEIDRTTPSEIAEVTGIHRSTIYRHLQTLCELDYVQQKDDNTYTLTARSLKLGSQWRNRIGIYQLGHLEVDEIAIKTGHLAVLTVPRPSATVRMHRSEPEGKSDIVDDGVPEGFKRPMHVAATGLAILAHLPDRRVCEVIDATGLPARTESTITDLNALFERLDRIQERGIAHTEETFTPGIASIAAPVVDDGEGIGAVGVIGRPDELRERRDTIEGGLRTASAAIADDLRDRDTD